MVYGCVAHLANAGDKHWSGAAMWGIWKILGINSVTAPDGVLSLRSQERVITEVQIYTSPISLESLENYFEKRHTHPGSQHTVNAVRSNDVKCLPNALPQMLPIIPSLLDTLPCIWSSILNI